MRSPSSERYVTLGERVQFNLGPHRFAIPPKDLPSQEYRAFGTSAAPSSPVHCSQNRTSSLASSRDKRWDQRRPSSARSTCTMPDGHGVVRTTLSEGASNPRPVILAARFAWSCPDSRRTQGIGPESEVRPTRPKPSNPYRRVSGSCGMVITQASPGVTTEDWQLAKSTPTITMQHLASTEQL